MQHSRKELTARQQPKYSREGEVLAEVHQALASGPLTHTSEHRQGAQSGSLSARGFVSDVRSVNVCPFLGLSCARSSFSAVPGLLLSRGFDQLSRNLPVGR